MKKTEVSELVTNGINQLSEALQAGKSATLVEYLNVMARFHSYSFNNILLITLQKPDATRVAGFQSWKSMKRMVRKGEKGIGIIAPMIGKKKDEAETGEGTKTLFGFKVVHVFDISQTDGEELPQFAQSNGEPGQYHEKLESLVRDRGIDLIYVAPGGGADGVSKHGEIHIRPDLPSCEKFSVLAHEFAHEILHHGNRRNETTKTIRETEAEAVAYVVCQAIGIETTTRSSDYIQLYCGNDDTLVESLDYIQKTASMILDGIMQHQPQEAETVS